MSESKNKKFFVTFGDNPEFPFGYHEFTIVMAQDKDEANKKFNAAHYREHSRGYAYAFMYTEEEFESIKEKYYSNQVAMEVLE